MSDDVGFMTMGRGGGAGEAKSIGVGMLGYAFMGKAHANGYRTLSYMAWPPPLQPRLVSIAGRDESAVAEAARRYGFERYATDWRELVGDPDVGLFDNGGPNDLHAEPTIAAAEAGKHVVCEKPLGRDADESFEIWRRVHATGVVHMCAFNYRFVPAVRLAKRIVESGEIGEIRHFRGRYLQEWGPTDAQAWRFDKAAAGSGALGDLGTHVIDLARYLVGEIASVSGALATFQPGREVDDAFEAIAEFDNGAIGTIEATRFAPGRKNAFAWEINGSKGSLAFDLERLNELQVSEGTAGFRTRLVSEADDPFWNWWWPHGHTIGWEHTFVHELEHLLGAIAGRNEVAPDGATFEDGYRASEVADAIVRSAASGTRSRSPTAEPSSLLHGDEHVVLHVDARVPLDDLPERPAVGDPVLPLDVAQHRIVQVEEPVPVAQSLELLLPDRQLQLAELRARNVALRDHAGERVEIVGVVRRSPSDVPRASCGGCRRRPPRPPPPRSRARSDSRPRRRVRRSRGCSGR